MILYLKGQMSTSLWHHNGFFIAHGKNKCAHIEHYWSGDTDHRCPPWNLSVSSQFMFMHVAPHTHTYLCVIWQAIFEIITSEHSYLHSLGILVRHFKSSEALRKTMTTTEHHHLFSNISVIHQVSQRWAQHFYCVFVCEEDKDSERGW